MEPVRLPLLDHVRVASPCQVPWESMNGDERVRFCRECRLNVYNLSSLTREEAERLIIEKEGNLCVSFHRRTDGTILTRDCPIGVRLARGAKAATLQFIGAIFAVMTLVAFLVDGRAGWRTPRARELEPLATWSKALGVSPPSRRGLGGRTGGVVALPPGAFTTPAPGVPVNSGAACDLIDSPAESGGQ